MNKSTTKKSTKNQGPSSRETSRTKDQSTWPYTSQAPPSQERWRGPLKWIGLRAEDIAVVETAIYERGASLRRQPALLRFLQTLLYSWHGAATDPRRVQTPVERRRVRGNTKHQTPNTIKIPNLKHQST